MHNIFPHLLMILKLLLHFFLFSYIFKFFSNLLISSNLLFLDEIIIIILIIDLLLSSHCPIQTIEVFQLFNSFDYMMVHFILLLRVTLKFRQHLNVRIFVLVSISNFIFVWVKGWYWIVLMLTSYSSPCWHFLLKLIVAYSW
jgi:hypothetical protein